MALLKIIGATAISVYALALIGITVFQRDLQYFPTNQNTDPASLGLSGVEVAQLDAPDGTSLVAWYAPAKTGHPTILYFHGNAGEISHRSQRFEFLQKRGYGVMFLSLRGYGGSTGSPTEAGIISDAILAYDWLTGRGVDPGKLVLIGESLGTGVAVQLAANRQVAAVMLEAPYSSTADVAASIYPIFPVRALMKDQFRSMDHISKINAPVLIQHGTADRIIPIRFGRRLYEGANEPRKMIEIEGRGHDAIFSLQVWLNEISFLEEIGIAKKKA